MNDCEALRAAAQRMVDKRTADSDGFWVSAREMRYLEDALTTREPASAGPSHGSAAGAYQRDDPAPALECLCGDVFTRTVDMAEHLWLAHGHEVPPRPTDD